MGKHYLFEAEKFGLSEESVHLLRNRFNYKTIKLSDINDITIEKGKDLKNWYWVLFIGIMLIGFVVYDLNNLILIMSDDETYRIYIERLLIPLFPLLLGIYTVVISLRNSKVMKVNIGSEEYYFSLRKIIKSDQYDNFIKQMRILYKYIRIK